MKNRVLHIAFSYFLVTTMLFSQVAVGFFHNRHDAHEKTVALQKGEFAIQKHGDHCKVCSLDLINHLFVQSADLLIAKRFEITKAGSPCSEATLVFVALSQGRAPPLFI